MLKERNVPGLKTRQEMLELVYTELFGYMPPKPEKISFEVEENIIPNSAQVKRFATRLQLTAL